MGIWGRQKSVLPRFFVLSFLLKRRVKMPNIGDTVIYGTSGPCRITGKEEKTFGTATREYYLLTPLSANRSTVIFVPTDNPALLANMHAPLTAKELAALLPTVTPFSDAEWGKDSRAHTKTCRAVLGSGDRIGLLRLVRTVLGESCSKPTNSEEASARRACAMLYEEFSLTLDLCPEDVIPLILGQITPKPKK